MYVAKVSWKLSKGAHWPLDAAVDDVVLSESHRLRVVPDAEEGTDVETVDYQLEHSVVSGN